MENLIRALSAGCLQQDIPQASTPAPTFLKAKSRAQGLAHDPKRSALIAEDVAPTAHTHGAVAFPPECNRSCSRYCDDAILTPQGSGQSDQPVMSHQPLAGNDYLPEQRLLVFRSSA